MKRATLIVSGLALAAVLGACGDDAPVAEQAPTAAPRPRPAVAAVASADGGVGGGVATQYLYSYNSLGKRDPFRGMLVSSPSGPTPDQGGSQDDIGCKEPLCQFDVDELNLVAVVYGDANPMAMVEDKGGTGHVVRRNTKMGKQGGKVTQILPNCLVVTSFVQGPDGKAQPNRTDLCVRQEPTTDKAVDLSQNRARE